MLHVTAPVWVLTAAGLLGLLAVDLVAGLRTTRRTGARAAGLRVLGYVALGLGFAVGLLLAAGYGTAARFTSGYLLEYSLSVDNLFVYLLLMRRYQIPDRQRHDVLIVGIAGTMVLRLPFLILGAAAVRQFAAVYYVFGALLLYAAVGLVRGSGWPDRAEPGSRAVAALRRAVPVTDRFEGSRLLLTINGRRHATRLLLAMVAVSVAGLVFALDSIPAIFGITRDLYLVVTANAFALLGLRQLYFLLERLLDRLVYLPRGLAAALGFVALKLLAQAAASSGVGGIPQVPAGAALGVLVVILGVTALASWRARP